MAPQTILITGANRGIGLEFVRQYAAQGHQVIATTRSPAQAVALQALAAAHAHVQIHALEVSDIAAIRQLAQQLADVRIDTLINNAGVYPDSRFGDCDPQRWLHAFQVNTLSTYYLAEAFLPQLRRSPTPKLIAMTSKMGSIDDNGSGGEYLYRTSKTALNMLVKSLSIDLRAQGLLVAACHPGWVRTDMGGTNGLIDVSTSVQGLRQVIAALSPSQTGQCLAYDGQVIAW